MTAANPSSPLRLGYIGMGIMGSAMAANLIKAGFGVTVWNRTPQKCQPLRELGAKVADSPRAMAQAGPDVICINVKDTPDVEDVILGEVGILAGAKPGLIVIDHSTISPVATRNLAKRMADQDVTLLDAPVSGGDSGARAGTLSIMVGGPAQALERCLPILQAVGKAITHVGDVGSGQTCKACNQVAVACNLMGVVEAMTLAQSSGLDPRKMIQVVAAGAGGSWQLQNLGPKIAAGDFAPGFMIDLMLKDLAIVAQSAREQHVELQGVSVAQRYFETVARLGSGREGTQAMAKAQPSLVSRIQP